MRWKPLGHTCDKNRRKNSCAESVEDLDRPVADSVYANVMRPSSSWSRRNGLSNLRAAQRLSSTLAAANNSVRHGTCFRRELSTYHAGAAPHFAVAEHGVVGVLRACP